MSVLYWIVLASQGLIGLRQAWETIAKPKTSDRVISLIAAIFVAGTMYFLWVGRP